MKKLLEFFNGYKTILAYVLLQIPGLASYPGLVSAIKEALVMPSRQALINVAIQLLLAVGVAHKIIKQIS